MMMINPLPNYQVFHNSAQPAVTVTTYNEKVVERKERNVSVVYYDQRWVIASEKDCTYTIFEYARKYPLEYPYEKRDLGKPLQEGIKNLATAFSILVQTAIQMYEEAEKERASCLAVLKNVHDEISYRVGCETELD